MTGQNHPNGPAHRPQGPDDPSGNRGPGTAGPRASGDAPSTWGSSRDDATIPPPGPGGQGRSPGGGAVSPADATVPPPGAASGGNGVWRTPSGGSTPGSPAHGPSSPVPAAAVSAGSKPKSRGPVLALIALVVVLVVLLGAIAWKLLQDDSEPAAEPAVPFATVSPDGSVPDTMQCPADGLCHTRKDDAQDSANAQEVNMQAIQALADVARTSAPGAPYPQTLEFDVSGQQAHYTCRHIGDERYSRWDCRTTDVVAGSPGFQVISTLNHGMAHFKGTIGDPDWQASIIEFADRGR